MLTLLLAVLALVAAASAEHQVQVAAPSEVVVQKKYIEELVRVIIVSSKIDLDPEFFKSLHSDSADSNRIPQRNNKRSRTRRGKRSQPLETAERAELLRVIRQLRADKSSAELECQQLRNRSENCEAETRRVRAQHTRDVERLRAEINSLDEDITNLRKLRREDIHDETMRSKQDKDTLLSEKERLHKHIVEITNKTIEIHQENLKLHIQINKLNQLNTVYTERLEERARESTKLEGVASKLQQEAVTLKQNLETCTEENAEMKRNKSRLVREAARLSQALHELTEQNEGLGNLTNTLRQELMNVTSARLDLMAKFDLITDMKERAATGVSILSEQIANFTEDAALRAREWARATMRLADDASAQSRNVTSAIADIKQQLHCHRKVMELGLVYLGEKHYFFSDKSFKMSWHEAQTFCRSHGLELAGVETEDEHDLIVSHLEQKFMSSWSHHWVGLTDEASEGQWVWSSTGKAISFSAWGRFLPGGGTLENCASVFRYSSSDFRWCDHPCVAKFPFVCELMKPCT